MMGAMLGNNDRNDALTAMLANGGNQQMWNNPFAYLIWLIFAGQFGGFGNNANKCIGDQIHSLQKQTTIQQLRDEIGRLNQTNALISVLKPSSAVTTTTTV